MVPAVAMMTAMDSGSDKLLEPGWGRNPFKEARTRLSAIIFCHHWLPAVSGRLWLEGQKVDVPTPRGAHTPFFGADDLW